MAEHITAAAVQSGQVIQSGWRPGNDDITRVRFGEGTGQDLPVNLAAAILNLYWKKSPGQFGMIVRQAMINIWQADTTSQNGHGQ